MAEAQKYYAVLTAAGKAAMVKAVALGQIVSLTHMAVGDNNGADFTAKEDMSALAHEVYRAPINALAPDEESPELLAAGLIIPHDAGGWTVRELGLFDAAGNLFAVACVPPTYKPQMQEGGTTEIRFRMLIDVSNMENIELVVDPTVVLATRDHVSKELAAHNNDGDAHGAAFAALAGHIKDTDDPHNTIPDGGTAGQVLAKQADGSLKWIDVAGTPVGLLCWSSTPKALDGTVAVNVKQKFALDVYPQLVQFARDSGGYLTDEAVWDAQAAAQDGACGHYCITDSHIILPCIKHYVGAARPGVDGKDVGDWQPDELKEHYHVDGYSAAYDSRFGQTDTGISNQFKNADGQETHTSTNGINTSTVGGLETRPKTSYLLPCIKAFDVAVNAAGVDMLALAQQLADMSAELAKKVDKGNNDYLSLLTLKSTRTSLGVWNITGLYVGKPVFISAVTATLGDAWASLHTYTNCENKGVGPYNDIGRNSGLGGNDVMIVPTAEMVSVTVSGINPGVTLKADPTTKKWTPS